MSTAPINVRLDPRRLEQLKAIATAMGLSNAAVISAMIREKIAAGVIPDAIPGIVVRKVPSGVGIRFAAGEEQSFGYDGARALVGAIRGVVEGITAPTMISMDHNFMVQKQGTGFKIAIPFGDAGVSFPPDLMLDLAGLIEKAAE